MSLRCRKGDLAMVIRGPRSGKVVTVLKYVGPRTRFYSNELHFDVWQVEVDGESRNPLSGRIYGEPDKWLMPIRPGDLKEVDETEKEVESVG